MKRFLMVLAASAITGLDPKLVIGLTGPIGCGKSTLLRAAAILQRDGVPFKLIVAGSGEMETELKALHSELGLGEAVEFPGYLKDLGTLYPAADIFVISSHLEGLCTSILDAMSAGLPVVATRTGGIDEAVDEGRTGLLAEPLARFVDGGLGVHGANCAASIIPACVGMCSAA